LLNQLQKAVGIKKWIEVVGGRNNFIYDKIVEKSRKKVKFIALIYQANKKEITLI